MEACDSQSLFMIEDPCEKRTLEIELGAGSDWWSWLCFSFGRGAEPGRLPLVFYRTKGSLAADLLVSDEGLNLVSEGFVAALRECDATGWSLASTDVEVWTKKRGGELISGYSLLVVEGEAAMVRRSQLSEVHQGDGNWLAKGPTFDPTTWDGSDLFSTAGTYFVSCTEKVRSALVARGCSNVEFVPVEAYEQSFLDSQWSRLAP
jgi:hypothetical protein